MDSIAAIGRESQARSEAFNRQLSSDLEAHANRIARLEQGPPGALGTAPVVRAVGNSNIKTGTYAPSGFSLTRYMAGLSYMAEGNAPMANRVAGDLFERAAIATQEFPAMAAMLQGQQSDQRVLVNATNSAGGYIVPPEVSTELIPLLRNKLVIAAMGATFLPNLRGNPFTVPKQTGKSTGYWITPEGTTDLTASDLTFGQLSMSPKTLAALVAWSRQLDDLSNPDVEAIVRNDIMAVIAETMETQMLNGVTASGKPTSILSTAAIGTITNTTVSVAFLNELLSDLEFGNVDSPYGIIWNGRLRNNVQSLKNAGDFGYLFPTPIGSDNVVSQTLGVKTMSTNILNGTSTTAEVISARWPDILVGMWGGLSLEVTTVGSTAWLKHQKQMKGVVLCDLGVRNTACVTGAANITFAS